MMGKFAKTLRDGSLILALVIFLAGVLQVILFGYDASLKTGLTKRLGLAPHAFAEGTIILALISIAFGIIQLSDSKK